MNCIIKDRVKIIRALIEYQQIIGKEATLGCPPNKLQSHLEKLIIAVRKDTDRLLSLSQEQTGKISYANKPEHKFDSEKRIRTSFGRYVRRQLGLSEEEVDNIVLAKAAARVSGYADISRFVKIIEGKDLYNAYQDDTFPESCMFGKTYVQFYADNPTKVKMATASIPSDNGLLKTRSLVWFTDQGKVVFDRVYPVDNGWYTEALKNWARGQGFIIGYAGEEDTTGLTVTMDGTCGEYPYLDTFCYATGRLDSKNLVLFTSKTAKNGYEHVLQYTDGGPLIEHDDDDDYYYCANCDHREHVDDTTFVQDEPICTRCVRRYYSTCAECGDYEHNDYMNMVRDIGYFCRVCARDITVNCPTCGERVLRTDTTVVNGVRRCNVCIERNKTIEETVEKIPTEGTTTNTPTEYVIPIGTTANANSYTIDSYSNLDFERMVSEMVEMIHNLPDTEWNQVITGGDRSEQ